MSDPTLIAALPDTLQTLPNRKFVEGGSGMSLVEQRIFYEAVQELQRNYGLMVQALKAGS